MGLSSPHNVLCPHRPQKDHWVNTAGISTAGEHGSDNLPRLGCLLVMSLWEIWEGMYMKCAFMDCCFQYTKTLVRRRKLPGLACGKENCWQWKHFFDQTDVASHHHRNHHMHF